MTSCGRYGQALVTVGAVAGAVCYWESDTLRLLAMSVNARGCKMSAMKVGKQVKVVSYYTPDAIERLNRLAASTRIAKAVYLREALDDLLKKYAGTLRKAAK